jgi:hypothetical protein
MNQIERAIVQGAIDAQKRYEAMTGGWWLSHGPELYLQGVIAEHIAELKHWVYLDCSIRKIIEYDMGRRRGRPAFNERQRPDISVWYKSRDAIRAVVEIKRAFDVGPVRQDAQKLDRILSAAKGPAAGYLLVYSEAMTKKPGDTLNRRFTNWQKAIGWKTIQQHVREVEDAEAECAAWGLVLFRAP